LVNLFKSFGFENVVNEPTRSQSCLDNVFLNFGLDKTTHCLYETGLSDYKAISVEIPTHCTSRDHPIFKSVITQKGHNILKDSLGVTDWTDILWSPRGVEAKWNVFTDCQCRI